MVNIAGKCLGMTLAIGISTLCAANPIELKIKSLDGAPLQAAGVGVPFLVEVVSQGRDTSQAPKIAGLETFKVQRVGLNIRREGNDTCIGYTFKVRIDVPGSFVIGPAVMYPNGVQQQSKAIRLAVKESQEIDPAYTQSKDKADAILQLSVDKGHVYVGQRCTCTLTFLGKKDAVKLEHIEEPKIEECVIGPKTQPIIDTYSVNGTEYVRMSWSWTLFPKVAGSIVIPACVAHYTAEQERNDGLSMVSAFFAIRTERKHVYSNALTITVDPLPTTTTHVDAVGEFKSLQAKIDPVVATEGEGMVLSIELEGDADFNALKSFQLQNMPQALRWYDSKQYIRDTHGAYGLPVKCFEFIVQGLQAGFWEIPAQTFTYFDVTKHGYVTLETAVCPITIKPNPVSALQKPPRAQEQNVNEQSVQPEQESQVPVLNTWASLRPVHERHPMSWWLFFVLAGIPAVWYAVYILRLYAKSREGYFKRMYAFKQARRKIKQVAHDGQMQELHTIFMEMFALRLYSSPAALSQHVIEMTLRNKGMTDDDLRSWDMFYTHMYERAFFTMHNNDHEDETLHKEALGWIHKLEKIL
jgi:hypothetical protein